jgi:hypothetical protein
MQHMDYLALRLARQDLAFQATVPLGRVRQERRSKLYLGAAVTI